MNDETYREQVALLLDVLSQLPIDGVFALKGGTAINLFIRDMPRLSVDIDLTYLPIQDRDTSLDGIHRGLEFLSGSLKSYLPDVKVIPRRDTLKRLVGLIVESASAQIKVEPNLTIRGAVFETEVRELCPAAQDEFKRAVSSRVLSFADIYGGKICAALDRQHPRDLFDVKLLLANEGISNDTRRAFIVYLVSHNRPMAELLSPTLLTIEDAYVREFQGMSRLPITREELEIARKALVTQLSNSLTVDEKRFLISIKEGDPKWDLLALDGIEALPSVQWKLQNIRRMEKRKHLIALEKLRECLSI